ncbi:DUF4214 domain-containing protein [Marinobacterium arenosum]|uniref:DUF4214 domain-containing protein n=1 Tax=Marinobacterium arenosum TaxID=2862496 RepID=UPI001C93B2F2|nr:DUF4214 domain-containing protein [Marinobacterium arenosum]MBY4675390.1 DUF4214 domain-containing protein [Marinobacterium arenosum]
MSTSAFIDQLYNRFLFRQADDAGKAWWKEEFSSGRTDISAITQSFVDSTEYQTGVAELVKLYYLVFDRIPDQGGLNFWVNAARDGMTQTDIATAFMDSSEFETRYGGDLSDSDFIDQLYQNAFNRQADDGGRNYWLEQLNQGTGRADLMLIFAQSAEFEEHRGTAVQTSAIYYGILQRQPNDRELAGAAADSRELISQLYASADYNGILPQNLSTVLAGDRDDNRLVGSAQNEAILAGSGDDILVGGGGADQLSGGDGQDRFQFIPGQSTVSQTATISDLSVGNLADSVEISGLAGYDFLQLGDSYPSLDAGLAAARAAAEGQLVVFTVATDTTDSYIYVAAQGDNAETLIKLQNESGQYFLLHFGTVRTLLEGTDGADVITHNGSLDSYIDAGNGDDQIYGGSEYDHIVTGAGNDLIDGREGDDLLDTSAAAAIANGSGQTITVNGVTVDSGSTTGVDAQATALIGMDRFSNIEQLQAGDDADYIALGESLRSAHAGGGDDILLDKPNSWSNMYGGTGQDRFVFQSATDLSTDSYDLVADFDASDDTLVFITEGNYQVADQVYQLDDNLLHSEVLEQLRANPTLADKLVFFKHLQNSWLLVNGDGGLSGASLHNTLINLHDSDLSDIVQLTGAVSFTSDLPSVI